MSRSSPQAIEYRRLIRQRGEPGQWDRWRHHLAELKGMPPPEPPLPRLTKEQLRQFWLDKFTLGEAQGIGGTLEPTTKEETG